MTEPARDPRLRARRAALVVVIASFFGILAGLCVITARFEGIYAQLEVKHLPPPTEAFFALAGAIRSLPGALALVLVGAVCAAMAWRGAFDGRTWKATAVCLVAIFLLLGFWTLAVANPLIQIQRNLSK